MQLLARHIEREEKLMIALTRTSLVVGAAITALGLGCSRSQSTPQPMTSSDVIGSSSPRGRTANNEPGATTSTASRATTDETGLPLPRDTTLVSSSTVGEVHVFPAEGNLGPQTRVVAGGLGANAVERVYETPLSYEDAVAFYDRVLELGKESPYSVDGGAARRTMQGNGTEWSFADDHGNPERIQVSGTMPTRISIAHGTATAAVATESVGRGAGASEAVGRANAQPDTSLGRSEARDAGRHAGHARDGGASPSAAEGPPTRPSAAERPPTRPSAAERPPTRPSSERDGE
jgi:hypothetical protein